MSPVSPPPGVGIVATTRAVHLPHGAEVVVQGVFDTCVAAVAAAGGVPLVIPVLGAEWCDRLLGSVDGLLLAGGPDVGEHRVRDAVELAVVAAATRRGMPLLGVCRGLQIVNVARGGSLLAHIDGHRAADVRHRLEPAAGSLLAGLAGGAVEVGSLHHQAVDRLGASLRVTARAEDGTVEALEDPARPLLAVQWHPEIERTPTSRALLHWLV